MMTPDQNEHQSHSRDSRRGRSGKPYLRFLAWFATGVATIMIAVFGLLFALLHTERGHRYMLGLAQEKAAEALGVAVQLENFTLHLSTLSLDLYGVRIAGAAPYSNPPLLQLDHLKVGIRVVSVFSRTWYFDQIQADHPVAWVVMDKNGTSNLPVFKSSGSSNTNLFDLGIRRVQINRGEVYYNSQPYALTANLHNLAFNSAFSSILRRYSGKLAYSDGNLAFGSLCPVEHNLEAEFSATPTTFELKSGTVTAGPSRATVNATLENYGNPAVKADYQIVLDGKQAAQILNNPTVPSGSVETSGTLQFHQLPNRSVVESLVINGSLGSKALTVNTSTTRASVADVSARYALANGNAELEELRARVLGGELAAKGTMQAIGGNSHSNFLLILHKISLAELERAFGKSEATRNVSLDGAADATATATWGKTIDDLVAHADLTLNGSASPPQGKSSRSTQPPALQASATEPSVPVESVIHATYSNASQSLSLNNSFFKSSQTNVQLNGTVSRHSSLSVNLQANNLSEIATFADIFRSPEPGTSALDLKGQATFHGTVSGAATSPDLKGQLSASNLEFNGTTWRVLNSEVDLSSSHAGLQNLRLQATDRGQATGNIGADLHDWSFTRNSAIQVDLTASEMSTSTIAKLAGASVPVTGTISANAHLHGSVLSPTGNANVHLSSATVYGEPISQAGIDLDGSSDEVKASGSVQLPAGSIRFQGTTSPHARTYNAQVNSSGIDLAKLAAIKSKGIDAKGVLEIHAQGQGSYDDPAVNADVEIPSLTMNGQSISKTKLQVNEAHHIANIELASSVVNAEVHGNAKLSLQGDYVVDGSLDTPVMPIQALLAAYAPGELTDMTGQIELHASIQGPLKNRSQLQAHLKLPVLKVAYGTTLQLQASPIQADYQDRFVRLQPVTIRGTDTELNVQGNFPVDGHAPASLQARGSVDLQIAQIFDPDLRASGQLKVNIDSHGTTAESLLAGEIDLADGNISTNTSPVGLQHANGVLKLTSDRLTIASFDGKLGGGTVSAQGALIYRPDIRADLGVVVSGAQILYPEGLRETADARLRLTGTTKYATLGGAVTLTNLSFTPAFDLSSIVDQFSGGVEVPATAGFQQNLQLNIAVNSTNNTSLVSRALSVDGSANLQIRGTAADPVILGRVNLTGGDVILNGNRFVLTGGTVQFINPAMTEPVLNVSLSTTIQEYKIDLRFRGPSEQLRTQYTSDPSLPQADIINLLAFGKTTEASAMNTASMNEQAEGLVASQVSSEVTSRISKAAGISQLSISPVIASGTAAGPPGANLTIQQRVTGNLFVTFSTNVATTQGQTIQGQYQVSPHVSVSATRDPNGGFAVDTLIKKSW